LAHEKSQRLQRLANQRQFLLTATNLTTACFFSPTYSEMISRKHSLSFSFLLVTNSKFSARVHYISTMVRR